ncbi:MAG TPA: class I SAM-dependent methyltransferase [Stellaceae bacterium]|jgi:SAM-dependent methyltransferase|nr:class I SAM-dependent methyltransferase [Stellaceae bacterium]
MWWFAAAHANLLALYRRSSRLCEGAEATSKPLLDAGCGTGGFLTKLAAANPGRTVIGLDADAFAARIARRKSGRPICVGSVNALPFADGAFRAIFSADVLCHRDVDELTALGQFRRCLAQGGLLLLNLPAYQWLLSRHDTAVANVRRYSRDLVTGLLCAADFRLLDLSYWNTILLPVMVITRKLLPAKRTSDVGLQPTAAEAVGTLATDAERKLLEHGLALPFGGSLLAVATNRGNGNA